MSLLILGVILFTVTLSACAQLALKLGVSSANVQAALEHSMIHGLFSAATSPHIWIGLIIYVLSVVMWLWVLAKVDLSLAYPFVGISFIVTMGFGAYLLEENVSVIRLIGTVFIALGCILVGKSA